MISDSAKLARDANDSFTFCTQETFYTRKLMMFARFDENIIISQFLSLRTSISFCRARSWLFF